MREVNYSFIIPHKNTPRLLQRCLDSIPQREDVEIIVVDNNSSDRIVDFHHYPGNERKDVRLIRDNESKGSGGARNTGLKNAIGKWVLFADADDYYLTSFLEYLDKYVTSQSDAVYFGHERVKDGEKVMPPHFLRNPKADRKEIVKYKLLAPWNKMVRREFLLGKSIIFEDSICGNDMYYTLQVAFFSKEIKFIDEPLYCYVIHKDSISNKKKNSSNYYLCFFRHHFQIRKFYKFIDHPEWSRSDFRMFLSILYNNGISQCFYAISLLIGNLRSIKQSDTYFIDQVKSRV